MFGTFTPRHGPLVTYRPAGDRCVLVEYGEAEPELALNFFAVRALAGLHQHPPPGFVDAAPGFRSILVRFDPERCSRQRLLDHLSELHEHQPDVSSLVVPSRVISLPIAFDDSETGRAVELYARSIRSDAPYLGEGGNIGHIAEQNGLAGPEELFERVLGTEWWTAFTGFAPGLPFTFSLRAPTGLSVPKYNPTRAWTPEGAVGMGGPCLAVFPVESPGSYQLIGRTVPIFDMLARNRAFRDGPFLCRAGDRLRFERVAEPELADIRRRVLEDRYEYLVEDAPFAVADYLGAGDGG
ncbi:5-oxoprolinase subunit B family protein [Saccharopolyspora griseoalba]|uniref:Allophanate hydrolase subunit 1 n=1 Tax=Saccharopolyspora griseoalba TaxID=1431848 RepID=A0ABW2LNA3_9PSEU